MNDWIDNIAIDDDWLIELLVDNELNDKQRRRLLAFLESQPHRWRRCALAFVESRYYGEDLRRLAAKLRGRPAAPSARPRRSHEAGRLRWVAAVAAGVAVALGVGFGLGRGWPEEPINRSHMAGEPSLGVSLPAPIRAVKNTKEPPAPQEPRQAVDFRLVSTEGVLGRVEVPVSDASQGVLHLLRYPDPLPFETRQVLVKGGFRVEKEWLLRKVELADGGQIAIPVDVVRLRNVGWATDQ